MIQLAYVSPSVVEHNQMSGDFVKTLIKVVEAKRKQSDKAIGTTNTYKTWQGQVMKYLTAYNILGISPEQWNDDRVMHFKNSMLSELSYSSDVARRGQDLIFETLKQCQKDGHKFIMPERAKYARVYNEPTWIEMSEIEKLRQHEFSSKKLSQIRWLFLIQCFSGVSHCDLVRLKKRHVRIVDSIPLIQSRRQKSGKLFSIPLTNDLKEALDAINWEIPIISNGYYNKLLREVAEIVGIEKYLQTHDGRRTCAMYYLTLSGNYEVPATVLGSTPEEIRKRYAPYLPKHLTATLKKEEIFGIAG